MATFQQMFAAIQQAKPGAPVAVQNAGKAGSTAGLTMNAMSPAEWKDILEKPLVTAAVGTALGKMFLMPEQTVTIFGQDVPVWLAVFVALYGCSFLGEVTFNKIVPQVSRSDKLNAGLSGLVEPAIVGGSNALVWNAVSRTAANEKGMVYIGALGGLSEVIGDYVYYRILKPWMM